MQGAAAQPGAAAAALPSGPGSAGVMGSVATPDPELEQLFGAGHEAELDVLLETGAAAQPGAAAASLPSGPGSAGATGSGSTFDPELEQLFGAGYEAELDALFEECAAAQPGAAAAALPSGPGSAGVTRAVQPSTQSSSNCSEPGTRPSWTPSLKSLVSCFFFWRQCFWGIL